MKKVINIVDENYPLPSTVVIALSNYCNNKCRFCPMGYVDREKEYMSLKGFKSLVADLKALKYSGRIELCFYNEPLEIKKLNEYLQVIKSELRGCTVMIESNGVYIKDAKFVIDLFESGLNQLKINIYSDGSEKDIERKGKWMMKLADYCFEAAEKLGLSLGSKDMYKSTKGIIDIVDKRFFMMEIDGEQFSRVNCSLFSEEFGDKNKKTRNKKYNFVENRAGFLNDKFENTEMVLKEPMKETCTLVFRRIHILHNGDVALCCNDFKADVLLGNVFETSIEEIWNSDLLNMYRLRLFNKNRNNKMCSECNVGSGFYVHLLKGVTFGDDLDKEILNIKYLTP